MENQTNTINTKILAVVIFVVAFSVGYLLLNRNNTDQVEEVNNYHTEAAMRVTVKNTIAVDGVLPPPEGFPQDIPYDSKTIVESATTEYPYEHTKQLYLSYKSAATLDKKYSEYLNYVQKAGYQVDKEVSEAGMKSVHGVKGNASLTVTVTPGSNGGSSAQISYVESLI